MNLFIIEAKPWAGVAAINAEGSIILVKKVGDKWMLPGGYLSPEEIRDLSNQDVNKQELYESILHRTVTEKYDMRLVDVTLRHEREVDRKGKIPFVGVEQDQFLFTATTPSKPRVIGKNVQSRGGDGDVETIEIGIFNKKQVEELFSKQEIFDLHREMIEEILDIEPEREPRVEGSPKRK